MAKTRTATATATATKPDVLLDDSAEHEAITPLMRRLAREYWEIIRARAAEEGLPIVKAWLSGHIDMEGTHTVSVVVHFDVPDIQAIRFNPNLDAYWRWYAQLDPEAQEACSRLFLLAAGIPPTSESANGG